MAQTFTDLEIVVVDDCSSDRTWAVAESIAARDGRIRMFRNPCRLGLVQNWNRSIYHCTGKWIKFLFQDDLLHKHCIEQMLSAANENQINPPTPLIVGDRDFLIEDGVANHLRLFYERSVVTLKDIFQKRSFIGPEALSRAIMERGVGLNFVGEPTSVMVKREMFTKYSFFNQNLIQLCDLEYWTRLGTNEGLAYVPETLSRFRVHNRSASACNHANRRFQLERFDRIILLHDYLYHPYYKNLRKWDNFEMALSTHLKNEVMILADSGGPADQHDLSFSLFEKYPILRTMWRNCALRQP